MHLEAPAKTNLSLRVLRRREDGFHEIETLMVPLALADSLTIETGAPGLAFTCSDPTLPASDDNLVVRAARLIAERAGTAPHWRIHLEKRVPHGAGLGGGSSDAATTLLGLNALLGQRFTTAELSEMAATLGSDVPFFLVGGPALCGGRGEKVTPADFSASVPILLLKPPFGVPTPWAYQRWRDSREVPGFVYAPQSYAGHDLVNDLERPVFEKYLLLGVLKNWLLAQPEVVVAMMSGSGSTMLALLRNEKAGEPLLARARAEFGTELWGCLTSTPHERPA